MRYPKSAISTLRPLEMNGKSVGFNHIELAINKFKKKNAIWTQKENKQTKTCASTHVNRSKIYMQITKYLHVNRKNGNKNHNFSCRV